MEIFSLGKLPVTESDFLVVQLPEGDQPLLRICKALLAAEISIHYAYPLARWAERLGRAGLHVEDLEGAVTTLSRLGFVLFTEKDFADEEGGLA